MSQSSNNLPPDVAQQWEHLHQEAQTRLQDLTSPPPNRHLLAMTAVGTFLLTKILDKIIEKWARTDKR